MEAVCDPTTGEALDAVAAAVAGLQAAGVTPVDVADARGLIVGLETVARKVRSLQVELVAEIHRSGFHAADGHASAKVMVRHHANLSNVEAARRARCATAVGSLPTVRAAFADGSIGGCQVERIARAHANPRVRSAVEANEASFAEEAQADEYRVFAQKVGEWVRLVDEDGTRDRDQAAHDTRDARLVQDFDGGWTITGRCGSLVGAELLTIFKAHLQAETLADWEQARSTHGDAATVADLPRTDAQRRFDALAKIFHAAADHHLADGGSRIVTNVVIDQRTFEHTLARLAGIDPTPVDDAFRLFPAIGRRCSTLDGNPVEATSAVAHALVGHVRRVVVGSDSVVIDLGRKRRLFTGPAALAVKLSSTTCYWPGCHVPVTDCQSDHLTPWSGRSHGRTGEGGGSTDPRNGGPACGRHNRLRNHGFSARPDPTGTWHITRPDGTEIT